MSDFFKKVFFIFSVCLSVLLVFGGGYFIGKKAEGGDSIPVVINNSKDPEQNVDFAPFWKVWNLLDQKFAPSTTTQSIDNQTRLYGAISGMVDSLNDPYTVFLDPEQNKDFEESIEGNFEGIGMEVGIEDDQLVVIAPLKNTPAEKSGIKAGDIILKIDDTPTQLIKLSEAVSKIRGKVGTKVKLTIDRAELKEPIVIEVTREVINIPNIDYQMRKEGIFVISLYNFSAGASSGFQNAIREFHKTKSDKLIIDLRGNPGGFLESAIDIAGWFLPTGKVVVKERFKSGEEKVFRSKGPGLFSGENLKVVILVDKGSASASEILAGSLKEHGVAKVVGTNTFGKGSVQELVDITADTSLKVTIAQWLLPNGDSISNGGLTPDFVVENEYSDEKKSKLVKDNQLEEAVKILLQK